VVSLALGGNHTRHIEILNRAAIRLAQPRWGVGHGDLQRGPAGSRLWLALAMRTFAAVITGLLALSRLLGWTSEFGM
jgi:hypothetical protein